MNIGTDRQLFVDRMLIDRLTDAALKLHEPVVMTCGEAPPEQIYINTPTPYFRAPQYYIAPPARFLEKRRVVTDAQAHAIGSQMCSAFGFQMPVGG